MVIAEVQGVVGCFDPLLHHWLSYAPRKKPPFVADVGHVTQVDDSAPPIDAALAEAAHPLKGSSVRLAATHVLATSKGEIVPYTQCRSMIG